MTPVGGTAIEKRAAQVVEQGPGLRVGQGKPADMAMGPVASGLNSGTVVEVPKLKRSTTSLPPAAGIRSDITAPSSWPG